MTHISIVLCTYNGASFLPQQLASLLAQSCRPGQIVISDDVSTDTSWTILEAFAQDARRQGIEVVLHRQPVNQGFVANFSWALARASGELVFLCDQDDVWHTDKLAVMAAEMMARPLLCLAHSNARRVSASGQPLEGDLFHALRLEARELRRIDAGEAFAVYARRNLATGAATVVRRGVLTQALPVPADWLHDEWLAVCAAALGAVSVMGDVLLDYRQHGGNLLGMRKRTWRDMWRHVFEDVDDALARQQRRLATLQRWLECADLPASTARQHRAWVREQQCHIERRQRLSSLRLARLPGVAMELVHGGYRDHATGWRTALHDLLRHKGARAAGS
ncbi:glycosyltransferase [Frateuria aurantia]